MPAYTIASGSDNSVKSQPADSSNPETQPIRLRQLDPGPDPQELLDRIPITFFVEFWDGSMPLGHGSDFKQHVNFVLGFDRKMTWGSKTFRACSLVMNPIVRPGSVNHIDRTDPDGTILLALRKRLLLSHGETAEAAFSFMVTRQANQVNFNLRHWIELIKGELGTLVDPRVRHMAVGDLTDFGFYQDHSENYPQGRRDWISQCCIRFFEVGLVKWNSHEVLTLDLLTEPRTIRHTSLVSETSLSLGVSFHRVIGNQHRAYHPHEQPVIGHHHVHSTWVPVRKGRFLDSVVDRHETVGGLVKVTYAIEQEDENYDDSDGEMDGGPDGEGGQDLDQASSANMYDFEEEWDKA